MKTFINLPVHDLQKTRSFFARLGFAFNEQFSDDKAICMIISEQCFAMLLTQPFFQSFTDKALADAHQSTEVLVALELESKAAVDSFFQKALAAGATKNRPASDLGFMFSQSFSDLDGHIWEVFWMDANAMPQE